jgi:hypothetical protein
MSFSCAPDHFHSPPRLGRRRLGRLLLAGRRLAASTLLTACVCQTANAQSLGSRLALSAHYGVGFSSEAAYDPALQLGAAVEIALATHFRAGVMGNVWLFAFDCVGFVPCANQASAVTPFLRYGGDRTSRVSPYAGVGIGRTSWSNDATGWLWNPHAGVELLVIRPIRIGAQIGVADFFAHSGHPIAAGAVTAGSLGATVRF